MKEYNFKVNGNDYTVAIKEIDEANAKVTVNGASFKVEFAGMDKPKQQQTPQVVAIPGSSVTSPTGDSSVRPASVSQPATAAGPATPLKSPLPGVILDIKVAVGDRVTDGQHLMVLEAMKMENNIDAHKEGVIKSISVGRGDSVLEGDILLTIE